MTISGHQAKSSDQTSSDNTSELLVKFYPILVPDQPRRVENCDYKDHHRAHMVFCMSGSIFLLYLILPYLVSQKNYIQILDLICLTDSKLNLSLEI